MLADDSRTKENWEREIIDVGYETLTANKIETFNYQLDRKRNYVFCLFEQKNHSQLQLQKHPVRETMNEDESKHRELSE